MPDFLVDAIATSNVDLAAPPGVLDTHVLVAGTSKVALAGQTDETENGVYDYAAGPTLVRNATDGAAASMVYPRTFGVRNGSPDNKHSEWAFDNDAAPALDADPVVITRARWPRALEASGGLKRSGPDLSIATTGITSGTYSRATYNDRGQATGGQSAEEAATFLEGLKVVRLSGTSYRTEEGGAYVPGAGRVLDLAIDEDVSGLALAASTWYYFYAYEANGALAVERSTVAPATVPYRGQARIKGPDSGPDDTRRLIAVRRTDASGNLRPYEKRGNWLYFQEDTTTSPQRVVSGGLQGAAWSAPVSCSAVVPPTSRVVFLAVRVPGGQRLEIGNNGSSSIIDAPAATPVVVVPFLLNASQQLYYRHPLGAPGTGSNIDVLGFMEEL